MAKSKFANLVQGLGVGMSLHDKYQQAKDARDLRELASATPEQSQGFTAEQGDELRRAAESGQYDIAYDEGKQAYTVTPKADPTQTGTIAQQGVTDFLGERSAGAMSQGQMDDARFQAMSGVIGRRDPVAAMRMQRERRADQRDEQRFGYEVDRAEREKRQGAQADADQALKRGIDADIGNWMKERLTGPDGQQRAATIDDHLAASQVRAAKLTEAGKIDEAGQIMKEYNAQAFAKIQLQGAERDQALVQTQAAAAAGNFQAAADFYNKYLPDGAQVTAIERGKDGSIKIERQTDDGRPMPVTVLKDSNQFMATLASFKDPMAVYNWSQSEFKNTMAIKADARADRADSRAGAGFAAGMADRATARNEKAQTAEAGMALFKERNPNATPAELEAVRRGVLQAVPKVDSNAPSEVKLGAALVKAGIAKSDAEGLQMAMQTKGDNPNKMRADVFAKALTATMGDAERAQEITEKAMAYLSPAPAASAAQTGAGKPAKGAVINGYEFLGGDPNSESNWRQVSSGKVK
jgi:hypothetical protein